jgi:DNA invertase Pin-like site-specific DNA recombinase
MRHAGGAVSETPVRNVRLTVNGLSDVFSTVRPWGIFTGTRGSRPPSRTQAAGRRAATGRCVRVWTDVASGSRDDRPELTRLLEQLLPGDTLVVWRLDRLGRSLRHLIDTVTALDQRGVGFRSVQESIDTTTAGGRLVFHVFAALAEFEVMRTPEQAAA